MVRAWLEANRVALGVAKRRPAVQNLRIGARNRYELSQATHQAAPARAHEAYDAPSAGSFAHAPGARLPGPKP
jgi:hypothetical protein